MNVGKEHEQGEEALLGLLSPHGYKPRATIKSSLVRTNFNPQSSAEPSHNTNNQALIISMWFKRSNN